MKQNSFSRSERLAQRSASRLQRAVERSAADPEPDAELLDAELAADRPGKASGHQPARRRAIRRDARWRSSRAGHGDPPGSAIRTGPLRLAALATDRAAPSCPRTAGSGRSCARRAIERSILPRPLEKGERVVEHHGLDLGLGETRRAHRLRGLRHFERIALSPVGRAVHHHALGAVLFQQLDHALFGHLGVRVDRVTRPARGLLDERQRFLVVVVDQHPAFVDARPRARGTSERSVPFFLSRCGVCTRAGNLSSLAISSCRAKTRSSAVGDVVVADLADADDAVFLEEAAAKARAPQSASRGSLASFGLSAIVQTWVMPNWLARKRSQPISELK